MNSTLLGSLSFFLTVTVLAAQPDESPRAAKIEFNRDIRPILSDACFHCHGPDKNERKAGLRLDLREEAVKESKSGEFPIVPGHPEKSDLVRRILTDDADERMPMVQRDDDKLLLLGALANLASAESLDLVVPLLDDPSVKREAAATVIAIAEKRPANQQPGVTRAALEKVVRVSGENPESVKRAQECLKRMEHEK